MDFAVQTSGRYGDVLRMARFAEDRGLPAIALPDHYLMALDEEGARNTPAPDAFAQLAALARDTTTIQLTVLVAPITFRHPAVLVKNAATIDELSGGRFTLGIGTGWMDREHEVFGLDYPPVATRFAMLEEALGYVTAALAPEPTGFSGKYYALEAFPIAPRPEAVRIAVGGTGARKTPHLAGTYADEFNVYPGPDLETRVERARDAAGQAGRDPSALLISSAGAVVTGATEAEVDAQLDEMATGPGMSRDELAEHHQRRNTPIGTYGQLKAYFAHLENAGVERFYLQGSNDPEATARLIDTISP
jgi:alkanesulfonate monooxygenase SsuD/methylene tetrahydromethanopterin reductase-like flavin-dependent oxidoreductase (luciferase family)